MNLIKKALVIFTLSASFVHAETIVFKTEGFHYTLNTSPEVISINGYLIDLSFEKKDCNKNLITSLHHKVITSLKTRVLVQENYHLVTLKNKEYKISKSSELGKLLYNFPNIAKANKKKESFICRNKK